MKENEGREIRDSKTLTGLEGQNKAFMLDIGLYSGVNGRIQREVSHGPNSRRGR